MFRPIRKKKNELSTEDTRQILREARRGVLAVNGEDGYPYAIPINFIYDETAGRIYFHSSRTGYKLDTIKVCDKVCFTAYGTEIVREASMAPYMRQRRGIRPLPPAGKHPETMALLKRFAMKYYPDEALADQAILEGGRAVRMCEIEIEHLSGKEVQER